jgi:hypothetical protein
MASQAQCGGGDARSLQSPTLGNRHKLHWCRKFTAISGISDEFLVPTFTKVTWTAHSSLNSIRGEIVLIWPDGFAYCLMRTLYLSYTKKKTPLPVPPHDGYWVLLELDPATLAASAK